MNTNVTIDKAGRVVIPKTLRDELHIQPGDILELACEGTHITLRPASSASPLHKVQGVWIFRGSKNLAAATTDKMLRDLREERPRNYRSSRS